MCKKTAKLFLEPNRDGFTFFRFKKNFALFLHFSCIVLPPVGPLQNCGRCSNPLDFEQSPGFSTGAGVFPGQREACNHSGIYPEASKPKIPYGKHHVLQKSDKKSAANA